MASKLVWLISVNRMRYLRGITWANVLLAFLSTMTFAKVWEPTLIFYNIPMAAVYIGIPVGYGFICWFIGWIDEKYGFWRSETTYTNSVINKEWYDFYNEWSLVRDRIHLIYDESREDVGMKSIKEMNEHEKEF